MVVAIVAIYRGQHNAVEAIKTADSNADKAIKAAQANVIASVQVKRDLDAKKDVRVAMMKLANAVRERIRPWETERPGECLRHVRLVGPYLKDHLERRAAALEAYAGVRDVAQLEPAFRRLLKDYDYLECASHHRFNGDPLYDQRTPDQWCRIFRRDFEQALIAADAPPIDPKQPPLPFEPDDDKHCEKAPNRVAGVEILQPDAPSRRDPQPIDCRSYQAGITYEPRTQ